MIVFLIQMSKLFLGFTKAVCVNGAAGDINVIFFSLEANSIQNERITEY